MSGHLAHPRGGGLKCPNKYFPVLVKVTRKLADSFRRPLSTELVEVVDEAQTHRRNQTLHYLVIDHLGKQEPMSRRSCYWWARWDKERTVWLINPEYKAVIPLREWV